MRAMCARELARRRLESCIVVITSLRLAYSLVRQSTPGTELTILGLLLLTAASVIYELLGDDYHQGYGYQLQEHASPGCLLGAVMVPWLWTGLTVAAPAGLGSQHLPVSILSSLAMMASLECMGRWGTHRVTSCPGPGSINPSSAPQAAHVDGDAAKSTESVAPSKPDTAVLPGQVDASSWQTWAAAALLLVVATLIRPGSLQFLEICLSVGCLHAMLASMPRTFTIGEAMVVAQAASGLLCHAAPAVLPNGLLAGAWVPEGPLQLVQSLLLSSIGAATLLVAAHDCAVSLHRPGKLQQQLPAYAMWTAWHVLTGVGLALLAWLGFSLVVAAAFALSRTEHLLLLSFWAVSLLLGLPCMFLLSKVPRLPNIFLRKGYHVLAMWLFIPSLLLIPQLLVVGLAAAFALFVLLELARLVQVPVLGPAVARFVGSFTDDRDSGRVLISHFSLLLGIAVPIWMAAAFMPQHSDILLGSMVQHPEGLLGNMAHLQAIAADKCKSASGMAAAVAVDEAECELASTMPVQLFSIQGPLLGAPHVNPFGYSDTLLLWRDVGTALPRMLRSCHHWLHAAFVDQRMPSARVLSSARQLVHQVLVCVPAFAGLLTLGVLDTAACIVGRLLGRHPVHVGAKKSMEGLLAGWMAMLASLMAMTCARNAVGYISDRDAEDSVQVSLFGSNAHVGVLALPGGSLWSAGDAVLCALLVSALEAVTLQLDNVVLPLHYFAMLCAQ